MDGPAARPGPSLKARALRYLAAREHSRAELAAKLARFVTDEDTPGAVERVLGELAAKGFIDEARVVESLVHRRAARLGNARVLQELRAKGVPEELIRTAASALRDTELARAQEVWRKKFGQPPRDAAERARQMRFLAARGFGGEVVRQLLNRPSAEDEPG
ncbi:MAG TPA: recombination regulator RecX [Ottowia sp.]|nr:recombination regulator RecX [Ottowia sp.]